MITDRIMLKWIKKRTRRLSIPTNGEPSCLSVNRGEYSVNEESQPLQDAPERNTTLSEDSETGSINNGMCPLCRQTNVENQLRNCLCRDAELDNYDSIDFDIIKRQTKRVSSMQFKNKLMRMSTSASYLNPIRNSTVYRSRSDVTGMKPARVPTRLSPRSRHPIINPADFAELSSEDDSSGYAGSDCSSTNNSGYSSDDSLKNMIQNMVIKQKQLLQEQSLLLSPCPSPVPKMGCRAMIQRSSSVRGRTDISKGVALRSQSLNRVSRPACGVPRSRSRTRSFRKERIQQKHSQIKSNEMYDFNMSLPFLDSHINLVAEIRTELQNLYILDNNTEHTKL